MKAINPFLITDFYKVDHRRQYINGTELVYSNWTPRKSRVPGINEVVFFGLQAFVKEFLIEYFNENFFNLSKEEAVVPLKRILDNSGCSITYEHIEELWELGYLPIAILALPEGSKVPIKVPTFTIHNTVPKFFWITNFLETVISCEVWKSCTSATLANRYKQIFRSYAHDTSDMPEFINWQGHDFSMRGMSGASDAMQSGAGHLLSFNGTDTIPAISYLEEFYEANSDKELIGASVFATEHSVMCVGSSVIGEFELFKKLITETYPSGIVSIVSDTWDLWKVLTDYLPRLKNEIMARDGKVVIRPDSGDPADILCGKTITAAHHYPNAQAERKGVIELLWDTFGGTINSKGYKQLDPHIGAIYGDSITLERAENICERLKQKGFASTNWVAGIGSYTYQYQTRDTFGFAMKATYCEVDGKPYEIFKDPITDDGTKKSLKGLIAVYKTDNGFKAKDQASWADVYSCALDEVFRDGKLKKTHSLSEIRKRLS